MVRENIYSSREKFIKKSKQRIFVKDNGSNTRIKRTNNSGLRRLRHILKKRSVRNFYIIFGFTIIALILVFSWFHTFRN